MVLWLAVTNDRYELPIAVEDSARLLGQKLGISKHAVSMALFNEKRMEEKRKEGKYKYKKYAEKSNPRNNRKIIKVEIDDTEDN